MGLNERTKICLSLPKKDLTYLDNLSEFLTSYNGYRFTRTSTIQFLLKYYRDNFDFFEDEKDCNKLKGQSNIFPF